MNKGALWNSIQEASNVGVEHPVHALPLDAHRQRVQRLVRAASGSEPVRESLEVHLINFPDVNDPTSLKKIIPSGSLQRRCNICYVLIVWLWRTQFPPLESH